MARIRSEIFAPFLCFVVIFSDRLSNSKQLTQTRLNAGTFSCILKAVMCATTSPSSFVWRTTTSCCQVDFRQLTMHRLSNILRWFHLSHSCMLAAGWSHFAQFTIAVVNKDPKKSKYSGELAHRHAA